MSTVHIAFPTEDTDDETATGGLQPDEQVTVEETATGAFGPTGLSVTIMERDNIDDLVRQVDVKPFVTQDDMLEAVNARTPDGSLRMNVDRVYREAVEARIAQAMGRGTGNDYQSAVFVGAKENDPLQLPTRNPLLIDDGSPDPNAPKPFTSENELVEAMSDPRYWSNETYRRAVDARVAVS